MSRTHSAGLSLASPHGRRTSQPTPQPTVSPAAAIRPFTDFAFVPPPRPRRPRPHQPLPHQHRRAGGALRPLTVAVSLVGNLVLVLAIAVLLAIAVVPRTGAYRTLTMLTASMKPIAPPGSVVVVTPQRPDDLRVGHVITFKAPDNGRVVTHRITSIKRDDAGLIVRTKGDANNAEDQWDARIAHDATVWRMRAAVPGLGHVISSLRQPRVQTTVRFVLPAVLLLTLLMSIWRAKPEDDR